MHLVLSWTNLQKIRTPGNPTVRGPLPSASPSARRYILLNALALSGHLISGKCISLAFDVELI